MGSDAPGSNLSQAELSTISAGILTVEAGLDVNIPNYASAIVTTSEIVDSIASL